jgi:ABC-type antimicrobial peptide transport system permease subunit
MRWMAIAVGAIVVFVAGWLTCFLSALAATKIDWKSKIGGEV